MKILLKTLVTLFAIAVMLGIVFLWKQFQVPYVLIIFMNVILGYIFGYYIVGPIWCYIDDEFK